MGTLLLEHLHYFYSYITPVRIKNYTQNQTSYHKSNNLTQYPTQNGRIRLPCKLGIKSKAFLCHSEVLFL